MAAERARSQRERRARRLTAVAVLGLTPVIALGWAGCSEDEKDAFGPAYVDPGGTHGAEISVSVLGRGRVTANVPGRDCPSDCFAKYIYTSAAADGAAGKVTLTATPTPGLKFKGWSFSTEPIGTRGRGPASCNPIMRAGSDPGVDKMALTIDLPYGETSGAAPAGQEGPCGAFTKVPVVYNVTAPFESDPPVNLDAGVDGDAGSGGLETIYNAPMLGAAARDVGITTGGYLYWRFTSGSSSGVAFGANPDGSAPQTPQIIVSPTTTLNPFEVDPYGVVYQDANTGTISVIRYGLTSATAMGGVPPVCTALAVDSSYNVYCRTSSTIVQWLYPSYTAGTVLYTGLPSGSDLVVESSSGAMYFSSANAILSLPVSGADGSIATPTTVVSGLSSPSGLETNSSRFFWLQFGGTVYASSSKNAPTTSYSTSVPVSAQFLAEDKNSSSFFWAASSSAIYHAYYFGGSGPGATQPFRTGLSGILGMTADSSYVFTAHSDGSIRRASTSGF